MMLSAGRMEILLQLNTGWGFRWQAFGEEQLARRKEKQVSTNDSYRAYP